MTPTGPLLSLLWLPVLRRADRGGRGGFHAVLAPPQVFPKLGAKVREAGRRGA